MSAPLRAAMAFTAVAVGTVALIGGAGVAWAGQGGDHGHGDDDPRVTLCHATSSDTNPYNKITVDASSVVKQGHDHHTHQGRGDIIPAFTYRDRGQDKAYPGKGDQSILANGCTVPASTTAAPTTQPPTTPAPTTAAPTTAAPTTTAPTTTAPTTTEPGEEEEEEWETPTTKPKPTSTTAASTTIPVVTNPEQAPTSVAATSTIPTPDETAVPATDPGTAVASQTEAVTTTALAGRLPETGAATPGLLVAGFGALLVGLGLVQLSTTRRRATEA